MDATFELRGVRVPRLVYGTAWKEERTAALTRQALDAGLRGIDTANQRKHYVEAGVGEALAAAGLPREQLYVQTKFTYARGQDHRLPYDPSAPLPAQVEQSFASSLAHLGVARLDGYVLHGPETGRGLTDGDWQVWRAMEARHAAGDVALLGVSNVTAEQVRALLAGARVAPAIVQNRCYARTGWDAEVRALCRAHGLAYQGFSLLTANRAAVAAPALAAIAARLGATAAQVVFAFALRVGMMPLTGTSSRVHLDQDLAALALADRLTPDDVAAIERAEA